MYLTSIDILKGEEIMTDMQFKSILKMVKQILKRADNIEDAREAINEILDETEKEINEKK